MSRVGRRNAPTDVITDSASTDGLSVEGITVDFGGVRAVDAVSFRVQPGRISSLIGPNGSGKTTMFNVINGFRHPDAGEVFFRGERITRLRPHQVAHRGIGRTFQQARVFAGVTVLECVLMGAFLTTRSGLWNATARTARAKRLEAEAGQRALDILAFLDLSKPDHMAGSLPYGEQKLLQIAIALAGSPTLLLLDEPAAGMNPEERRRLVGILRRLAERGGTVLLVEHHMKLVMDISHHVIVMSFGRKIAEGSPGDVASHPDVVKAYLGEGYRCFV